MTTEHSIPIRLSKTERMPEEPQEVLSVIFKLMTIISLENPHLAMMTSINVDGSPAISKSETISGQFCEYFNCMIDSQPSACYSGDSEEVCEILSVMTEVKVH